MLLTKPEGKPPRDIANAIVKGLVDTEGIVAKVEVAGPGFLNFTLKRAGHPGRWRARCCRPGTRSGAARPKSTGKRVMVEFVSANPTGPVHIGHARGAFMGDAVARLLEAAGHDVTREFYINDFGKQVETLGRTVHKRYRRAVRREGRAGRGRVPGRVRHRHREDVEGGDGDKYLKAPSPSGWRGRDRRWRYRRTSTAIRQTLEKAGIRHDVFFSEASLHAAGKVKAIVDDYKKRGATYEAAEARRDTEKVRERARARRRSSRTGRRAARS